MLQPLAMQSCSMHYLESRFFRLVGQNVLYLAREFRAQFFVWRKAQDPRVRGLRFSPFLNIRFIKHVRRKYSAIPKSSRQT